MKLATLARWSCAVAVLGLCAARPAAAAWTHNSAANLPVCTATNDQLSSVVTSDGSGGAIAAWVDLRSGTYDIYAQHILVTGTVDPAWPVNGRALCTAASSQLNPAITSDGAGGAIVAWHDSRTGNTDIYAQHVLASGAVDPAWPLDGRALCSAANVQILPCIVSDGSGGAIVAWQDFRNAADYDIYAQHVLSTGVVDAAWPANGRAVCTAGFDQNGQVAASDGAGGVIVSWYDIRSGIDVDIYAQHILATGAADPLWPANGRQVCGAANNQYNPAILSDAAGGAIVAWQDGRGGIDFDVYVQHVQANGSVDFSWPANGRSLCTVANNQLSVQIVADGSGGAIVTWQDFRGGSWDIYANHILPSGQADAAWPLNGRALCTAASDQYEPYIVSDGAGGALVGWYDYRSPGTDVYVQHLVSTGVVDAAWPVDGRALATASSDQTGVRLATDGAGGAIAVWYDLRSGGPDIYAQRVARFGQLGTPEPVIASVRDVPNDQGGKVKVSWDASWLDTDPSQIVYSYWIFRSVPPSAAMERIAGGSRACASPGELDPASGGLLVTPQSSATIYWEFLGYQQAYHILDGYSYLAATAGDSVGGYNPRTKFMVVAWNGAQTQYWMSRPDSGYSVDNLGPATPAPFTGQYNAGNTALHWNPNSEPDLAGYRLYRGTTAGFVPGPGNLVVAQSDTGFVDVAGAPYYYKLTAVDLHGNESPPALLLPSGTTDVGPFAAGDVAFAAPAPNPARTGVVLRIALPREARVSLAVYDVNGARVRTLIAGRRSAGEHPVAWDLRSERGARVPAGLYFARLEVEGRTWTRRIAALE